MARLNPGGGGPAPRAKARPKAKPGRVVIRPGAANVGVGGRGSASVGRGGRPVAAHGISISQGAKGGVAPRRGGKPAIAGVRLRGQVPIHHRRHQGGVLGRVLGAVSHAADSAPGVGTAVQVARLLGAHPDRTLSGGTTRPALAALGRFLHSHERDIGAAIGGVAAGSGKVRKGPATRPAVVLDAKATRAAGKFGANFANDYVDFYANLVPATYHTARQIAHGQVKQAGADLVEPVVQLARHPGREFYEHPWTSLMIVRGAEAAVGRGAGGVMRSGALGGAAKRAAGTARPHAARVVPHTNMADRASYSPDVFAKAVQVLTERARGVDRSPGAKPQVMTGTRMNRRADETVAAVEDIRRVNVPMAVQQALLAASDAAPKGKRGALRARARATPIVSLASQGFIPVRPSVRDVRAYLSQTEAEIAPLRRDPQYTQDVAAFEANKALIESELKKGWDPAVVERQARGYARFNRAQQDELVRQKILPQQRTDTASVVPYAVMRMGARVDENLGLVDAAGNSLPVAAVRAHMADPSTAGGAYLSEPAFVSHTPNMRGAKNYYLNPLQPPRSGFKTRTGIAAARGVADVHPETLLDQAARTQGLVEQARGYSDLLGEVGIRGKDGKLIRESDKAVIERIGQAYTAKTGIAVRPVRLSAVGARGELTDKIATAADAGDAATLERHVHEAIGDALQGKGEGPWALMPDVIANRVYEHNGRFSGSTAYRVGNAAGSLWRKNVLAFSPKWLMGNLIEPMVRAPIAGATPMDYVFARKVFKSMEEAARTDPQLMRALSHAKERTTAGGHMSLVRRNNVTTRAEHFADSEALRKMVQSMARWRRRRGTGDAVDAWKAYTDFVFHYNGRMESVFQTAMLGKAMRQIGLTDRRVFDVSKRAADEAAKGMFNTNTQVELGRIVDKMYGRYGKWSPFMRRSIATWTPFAAWTFNAAKFLMWTLPKDHPVLTGVLAAQSRASEEWRTAHGLKVNLFSSDSGMRPDFLMGGIPGKDDSILRLNRYTPTGLFANEGGALGAFASQFAPQINDVLQNALGRDWRGKTFGSGGNARSAAAVATSMVESLIPGSSQAVAVSGVRLPNTADSQKGEGSVWGRFRKQFDPFLYSAGGGASKGSVSRPGVLSDPAIVRAREKAAEDAAAAGILSDPEVQKAREALAR